MQSELVFVNKLKTATPVVGTRSGGSAMPQLRGMVAIQNVRKSKSRNSGYDCSTLHCVNRADKYFPGPRPIGSHHNISPWPVSVVCPIHVP
jgi:hypothetical protein